MNPRGEDAITRWHSLMRTACRLGEARPLRFYLHVGIYCISAQKLPRGTSCQKTRIAWHGNHLQKRYASKALMRSAHPAQSAPKSLTVELAVRVLKDKWHSSDKTWQQMLRHWDQPHFITILVLEKETALNVTVHKQLLSVVVVPPIPSTS